MTTFLMLGRYSCESLKGASAKRTVKVSQMVAKEGGKVKVIMALLGRYDLAMLCQFPDVEAAMKTSLALNKSTGIAFETFAAVSVDDFDRLLEGT